MKKWNTSITFESHEEVVGVLSALENCASHSRYFSDELDAQFF